MLYRLELDCLVVKKIEMEFRSTRECCPLVGGSFRYAVAQLLLAIDLLNLSRPRWRHLVDRKFCFFFWSYRLEHVRAALLNLSTRIFYQYPFAQEFKRYPTSGPIIFLYGGNTRATPLNIQIQQYYS